MTAWKLKYSIAHQMKKDFVTLKTSLVLLTVVISLSSIPFLSATSPHLRATGGLF